MIDTTVAREQILSMFNPIPLRFRSRVDQTLNLISRIEAVREILDTNQELKGDLELIRSVVETKEICQQPKIRNLGRHLLYDCLCYREENSITPPGIILRKGELGHLDSEKGTLFLSESVLDRMNEEQLWDFIKKNAVKELSIYLNEKIITFEETTLKVLIHKVPSIEDLKTQYKIKFACGHELCVAKAKLQLCGKKFKALLRSSMRENVSCEISLAKSPVTFQSFCEILKSVETGEAISDDQACKIACDYLIFKPKIPKGFIGLEQWNSFYKFEKYGLKAKQKAPPIPKNILKGLEGPSLYFEGKSAAEMRFTFLMPAGLTINTMEKLAMDHKLKDRVETGFRVCWDKIREKYGDEPIKDSYWISTTTEMLPNSGGLSREKQVNFEGFKNGDQASTLLEAIVLCFLMYHSKGERPFSKTYITCIEDPIGGWKLVVGGFSASGPSAPPASTTTAMLASWASGSKGLGFWILGTWLGLLGLGTWPRRVGIA